MPYTVIPRNQKTIILNGYIVQKLANINLWDAISSSAKSKRNVVEVEGWGG